ncbi:unnamed protein product [Schistosoma curassoni]|uniref:CCHC-type domain-containing protein n=1 Tax=Schistosoma curassoni TaxID=6186 RepID=A0A183KSQ9_9TREM|nr:unnamed protein product [Schistosoma curassoni]
MELLDIHSDFGAFEDYFERFEIWAMTKVDDEDVNIVAHFLTFIGKEAYSLLKTLALPEMPISLSYTTFKDLLLDYVNYANFECDKGERFRKTIHEDIKNSTTLRHPNPVHTQGYADNSLRGCNAFHEDGQEFGQCLSCGKFHSFNSCKFRNSECLECDDIGHIQSVCNTTIHLGATNISLNSHAIVPGMAFPNDSHISDEMFCKSEENMLSEHNYDQKPDVVLVDADFSNDPLLYNDILNKFEETISEESKLDVIPNIICPHNAFVSCGKLVQCEARVLNDLDFDYNWDDFISTAVHPYHKSTSNVYSYQYEKYVLNEATLFITW